MTKTLNKLAAEVSLMRPTGQAFAETERRKQL